ncbi:MAG: hypothetical protein AMK72_06560 [Planctomycetes bacterium SM23_25]|nr:MAG: hypothetical protein AMK72_06560 [Planctomycetes bacterium SM23_25]
MTACRAATRTPATAPGGGPDGDCTDSDDQHLYYCTDANFNVTSLVETDGDVVERYVYDPYGKVTVLHGADDADGQVTEWDEDTGGSDWDNEILFCGYRYDPETALYHVRHRMYHATLGRWLQRDPLGYVDGMGLYEYVGSGPLGTTDPMGLRPMGPQDPGYQPGYENLPWKDIPDGPVTEKEKPGGGGPDGWGGGGGGGGRGGGGGAGGGGGSKGGSSDNYGWDWAEGLGLPGLSEDGKWYAGEAGPVGGREVYLTLVIPGRSGEAFDAKAVTERLQVIVDTINPKGEDKLTVRIQRIKKIIPKKDADTKLGLFPKNGDPPTEWKQEVVWASGTALGDFHTQGPITTVNSNVDGQLQLETKKRETHANVYANALTHEVLWHGVLDRFDWPSAHPFRNGYKFGDIPRDKLMQIPPEDASAIRGKLRLK